MTKIVNGVDGSHLKNYIERIEKLEEDKKALAEDIKEIFNEAKGFGYDIKIMREVMKLRKMDENELFEKESLIEIYRSALGMSDEDEAEAENVSSENVKSEEATSTEEAA